MHACPIKTHTKQCLEFIQVLPSEGTGLIKYMINHPSLLQFIINSCFHFLYTLLRMCDATGI